MHDTTAPDARGAPDPRDHRQLGRELGLFTTHPQVGAGLPLWLPAGSAVRSALERYILEAERRAGYQHVHSPALAKRELYERSGHWAHYAADMFPPMRLGDEEVVLRPMNCPHHLLVYAALQHSWRDLPVRIAELGAMYRNERSGVVGGLSRVRAMTLNDGHVLCAPEQVPAEAALMLQLIEDAYATLGIDGHRYRLSLRDTPGRAGPSGKYVDEPAMWERTQAQLRAVLVDAGVPFEEAAGEAAFYGPKIDVQVRDHRGREETLSTVQLDVVLPERFDLVYTGANGRPHRPVLLHRSVTSTVERMVAHLVERHGGALPPWLAPWQLVVLPVAAEHEGAAARVADAARAADLRAHVDQADRTLGARVRDARHRRECWIAVVGEREVGGGAVALRLRDGRRLAPVPIADAVARMAKVVASRDLALW